MHLHSIKSPICAQFAACDSRQKLWKRSRRMKKVFIPYITHFYDVLVSLDKKSSNSVIPFNL